MSVRSLHVPFTFFPDAAGGTEVYVASLARHLRQVGQEAMIAAPGNDEVSYRYGGLSVRRFPVSDRLSLRELYSEGDRLAARSFARILQEEQPDVVHLHAWSAGVSLQMVHAAKRRNIPVVFTYHTPGVSCPRGTLMRWGRETCDGALNTGRCTACALHGLGAPLPLAWMAAQVPVATGRSLGELGLSGDLWTGLRMRELVALQQANWRALLAEVDRVVAPGRWVEALLLGNGVDGAKLILSRQGIEEQRDQGMRLCPAGSMLRVAYLGRFDPAKGVDLLIRAIRTMPTARVKLDLFGIVQGSRGTGYEQELRRLARSDSRITFRKPVPGEQIVPLLRDYHLLAVPSQGLETGPLVVLEAFAAGIPVLGSDRGGIAELVTPGVDGLLVESRSVHKWRQALQRLASDRQLLARLQAGVRPPRAMADVAREMAALYQDLLAPDTMASEALPAATRTAAV